MMIEPRLLLAATLIFVLSFSIPSSAEQPTAPSPPTKEEVAKFKAARAVITSKLGEIRLEFFPETAPVHVKNFISLAEAGFYNQSVFHRVIPGFMIQGGDPISRDPNRRGAYGTGGPGYTINAEFSKLPHNRGTLSMARTMDPNSAGSQFFICVAPAPHLNGQYTVFGEVESGLEVVDKIVNLPRDRRDNPLERVEMTVKIVYSK